MVVLVVGFLGFVHPHLAEDTSVAMGMQGTSAQVWVQLRLDTKGVCAGGRTLDIIDGILGLSLVFLGDADELGDVISARSSIRWVVGSRQWNRRRDRGRLGADHAAACWFL